MVRGGVAPRTLWACTWQGQLLCGIISLASRQLPSRMTWFIQKSSGWSAFSSTKARWASGSLPARAAARRTMYSGIPDLNSDGEGSDMVRASVGTEEMGGGRSFGSNSSSSGGGDFGGIARKSTPMKVIKRASVSRSPTRLILRTKVLGIFRDRQIVWSFI